MKKHIWFLLLVLFISTGGFAQNSPKSTDINVPGLKAPVTVRKDGRGIPYIEAQSDDDLYFAQGYVTASDRLWQMDLLRRTAGGELSEIFGKAVLEEDKRWRRYGFKSIVEQSLPMLSPGLRAGLESYARGVNAYIASLNDTTTPVEFKILQYKPREWKASDALLIGKILAEGLSSTWRNDLMRLSIASLPADKFADLTNNVTKYDVVLYGKDTVKSQTAKTKALSSNLSPHVDEIIALEEQTRKASLERIGFYAEDLAASNNWVISGKRTKDGKAMLANDPHLSATAPGIWYLVNLSAPGIRTSGVAIPGTPGVALGHNEFIAWGATNVGPDVQDLYIEEFDSQGRYKTQTGWEQPKIRREEIKVRKVPTSPETEVESFEVTETRNGVLISDADGKKYALKWTARDPQNQEWQAFYLLNRARNWSDFTNALKTFGGAAQNFVYADTKGNIGWYAASKIPIRKTGDGAVPYKGWTGEGNWIGYIPFAELPHLYNPPSGMIVTANQRIVGTDYKYQFMTRDAAPPWRARRIYDLIEGKRKLEIKDSGDIQYDNMSMPVSMLARYIIWHEAASHETLAVLRSWDGKMSPDSRGALLANEIRNTIAQRIADDNKPALAFIIRERIMPLILDGNGKNWLPEGFASYAELFKACDKQTREALAKRYGADESKWIWGNNFQASFMHPLASAPFIGAQFKVGGVGINGSGTTPNVGSNVSMRHVTSPGNWDETRHVIPLGESGRPNSPFWKDQFEAWSSGNSPVFPFTRKAVEAAAKEIWVLKP